MNEEDENVVLEVSDDELLEDEILLKRPRYDNGSENESTKKKTRFKQPTVEELNELNETQTLFNSNLFRLQIKELMEAVKIKNIRKERVSTWIDEFRQFLNTIPVHEAINISKFCKKAKNRPSRDQRFITNITYHCKNNLRCDQDIEVLFVRPDSLGTFGLFKLDSLPGPDLQINVQLTIPRKCFHIKDFLNNRYPIKKFYYLMYIAEHLKSKNICSSIKCGYYNENVLLPYLIICPSNSEKVFVNIFLIPEANYFKKARFLPEVNNIKAPIFEEEVPIQNVEVLGQLSTVCYNASLAFDVTLSENNVFIQQALSDLPNVQEGLKLIILWINQRKFNEGIGAFTNDIITYIIVYLVVKKKINKHMSSYQVYRNFLNFMVTTDLTQTPISICGSVTEEIFQKFKGSFDVVIIDSTGYYNVASFLNLNVYMKMKYECQLAFTTLDQDSLNSFSNLFLVKIPFCYQYDAIIDIKSENNFQALLQSAKDSEKGKYLGNHMLLVVKILQEYVKRGLNQRCINIVPFLPNEAKWDYGIRYKMANSRILFGIQLNPDCAFDIMEFGPALNDPKEKEFKQFWGRLASNRRFRDGTAKVVVHFDTNTIKGKREIIKTIVNFIMEEKLQLEYKFYYDEFEEVLVSDKVEMWYPNGTNEETTVRIIRSSDELGRKIRNLGVQLGISGIGTISDVYCYANVFPPIPTLYSGGKLLTTLKDQNIILKEKKIHASPKYVEPIECAIYLEHSSKWPGDLKPLQQMKILFSLQISKLLLEKHQIISSVKSEHIDVLFEGLVFRYTLYLSKEIALLKRQLKPNGVKAYKDTNVSLSMEKKLIVTPKIIGALKGIQSQFPSYGVSTCLAKRWIRSQLLDDYLLPDMVINLLNAHQYLNHSLHSPTVNPQVALLRFLKYIVDVSWDSEPVVINFNKELTGEQISKIDNEMRANRSSFPPLYILTPYDNGDSIFTQNAPSIEVLFRLKLLAKGFLNIVNSIILEESLYCIKDLFIPNMDGFNCILNLHSLVNCRRHEQLFKHELEGRIDFKEPSDEKNKYLPVIGFNPVQSYLNELRTTYGTFCIFFHDTYGGNRIGVLWNPNELEPKDVKLTHMLGRKFENDKLLLDTEEIIRGFRVIGMNILKSIDVET